jgi:hypothetical protein
MAVEPHAASTTEAPDVVPCPKPNGAAPIPDPGVQPVSKYATAPRFASGGAVATSTPVSLDKPKTFCRAFMSMAVGITMVDLAKATQTGKRLYLITPEAIADGAMDRLPEAYEALAVPMMDRDGAAFLWPIRQFSRDGVQIGSYDEGIKAAQEAEHQWVKFYWQGGGYVILPAPRQDLMGELKIPPSLTTFDAWVESAFRGVIIRTGDAVELQRLRGDA